jgi:transcriptional regulator with XRE-family HTH domain
MTFGDDIYALRTERGWTQREVEDRCGLSHRTITRYEASAKSTTPNLMYAQVVMKAFGFELQWVKVDDDPQPVSGDFVMGLVQKYGVPQPRKRKELPGQLAIDDVKG